MFALLYFQGLKGHPISAEMLILALHYPFAGEHYIFEENSRLTQAIKASKEYKRIIEQIVKSQDDGYRFYALTKTSTEFTDGDLKTCVGKTDASYYGEVCKSHGRARLNLRVAFYNRYDFDHWGEAEVKKYGLILATGNNLAHYDQLRGVITPYWWTAAFDETRRWPW